MNLKVVFVRLAGAELEAAVETREAERPGLGLEFADAVEDAIERARAYPRRCAAVPSLSGRGEYRRVKVPRFHFLVVFELLANRIRIVAVSHERQDHAYWTNRITDPDER